MLVGKTLSVGKENIGQENSKNSVELSVGKPMSVGKGLCRPDLQLSVSKTNPRPTFCWCKQLSRPTCLLGFWCCGVVNVCDWRVVSCRENRAVAQWLGTQWHTQQPGFESHRVEFWLLTFLLNENSVGSSPLDSFFLKKKDLGIGRNRLERN
jgi:hypothetical protein